MTAKHSISRSAPKNWPVLAIRLLVYSLWPALLPGTLPAQTPADSFRLTAALPVRARFATADKLGNIYLLTLQNALEKYTADGRLLARYTNNRLGNATLVDPGNPLKVLVWYGDFRTIVFLDRNLTALGTLDLVSAGYPEVRCISAAADGNLWVYDESNFQLRKLTPAGEPLQESQRLDQLQAGRVSVTCLRDNGNEVLVADPQQGLFWFDAYGQYVKSLPWTGITTFSLQENDLAYCDSTVCRTEQLQAFATRTRPLPATARAAGAQFWLAPGMLLIQNGDRLELWQ